MMLAYAILVGLLTAVGVYLLLHSDAVDKVLGLVLLGHAGNLVVFGAGDLVAARSPVLDASSAEVSDPLPQALVLTAIVIGFGLVAFAVVLVAQQHRQDKEAE